LIQPALGLPARYVIRLLDETAGTRGYPDSIRVDNGPEFIAQRFKDWAEQRGILLQYIQPGKPAQNGFIERFNRTYREDILDMYLFDSLDEVRQITTRWMHTYNQDRPHESLGNQSPVAFAFRRGSALPLLKKEALCLSTGKQE